jgi:nucleotide-binding universal stress UspA family protein
LIACTVSIANCVFNSEQYIIDKRRHILAIELVFKKILVPYDGSGLADKALEHAVSLAKMYNSSNSGDSITEIIILHVVPEIPITNVIFERSIRSKKTGEITTVSQHVQELYQQMKDGMKELLEEKRENYKKTAGEVSINTTILVGSPVNKILEFSKNEKIDLIVIGSIGRKGISKFFRGLGSVSRSVSERAKCPVMIIH